jgi:opacity protein-like surface antigen
MRRFLQALGATAIAAATPAQAQPVMDWSGFHAGLVTSFGFGGHTDTHTGLPAGPTSSGDYHVEHGTNGWAGGLVGGYFWQQGPLVEGFETDIAFGNAGGIKTLTGVAHRDGSGANPANFLSFHEHTDTFGDLRGSFGYAASTHFLPYFTAGYMYLHGKYGGDFHDAVAPADYLASDGAGRSGWTIGAGVACQFRPGWVIKGEYLYYDVGRHTALSTTAGGLQSQFDFEGTGSLLRLALTVKVP